MRMNGFLHMDSVRVVIFAVCLGIGLTLWSQTQINYSLTRCGNPSHTLFSVPPVTSELAEEETKTLLIDREDFDSILTVAAHMRKPMPKGYFAPPVFTSIAYLDTLSLRPVKRAPEFAGAFTWIDEAQWHSNMMRHTKQYYMVAYPEQVRFNVRTLPVPPKNFRAFVDPVTTMIVLEEENMQTEKNPDGLNVNIAPKHWITDFTASLQFSQAYISPNWYQGGTRNLNMIAQAIYNVKLNQKLHPKLMFEATVQYKLGMNSAPDDTVRSYNISEDLFQANAKFGLKALKRSFSSSWILGATTPNWSIRLRSTLVDELTRSLTSCFNAASTASAFSPRFTWSLNTTDRSPVGSSALYCWQKMAT